MNILRRITGAVLCALILAGAGALGPAGARAQPAPGTDTGDPNVVVDFSVLEDAGYAPAPVYTPAAPVYQPAGPSGRRLLIPGPKNPVSQLHVAPVQGSKKAKSRRKAKVAAPRAKRKLKAAAPPAKPKMATLAPPPAKAPEKPPVTVSAVPAPSTAPPPARPAPAKKAKPAPAPKPEAAPSPALTPPPPPPVMAETTAQAEKAPEAAAASSKAEPTGEEKAALPPAGAPLAVGRALQILYKAGASKLPGTARAGLKALAGKLKEKPNLRLQLMAYAGGESLSAGKARRLSLSRALSVRSYLIENGVRSTRIDVRALGNKSAEEPLNRVDVNVAER